MFFVFRFSIFVFRFSFFDIRTEVEYCQTAFDLQGHFQRETKTNTQIRDAKANKILTIKHAKPILSEIDCICCLAGNA